MKIGIDMDSVIAEIITPLDRFHNARYHTSISYEQHRVYNLMGIWDCSEEEMIRRIHEFYMSGHLDETLPVEGAIRGIEKLARKHTLILITSRPEFIEKQSVEWLDRYFKGKFAKICHTNQVTQKHERKMKKSEICLREGVTLMIDDHMEYAYDCAEAGIDVFLFEAPWNKLKTVDSSRIKRVANWDEVIRHLCA